jgi:hypothetical protein
MNGRVGLASLACIQLALVLAKPDAAIIYHNHLSYDINDSKSTICHKLDVSVQRYRGKGQQKVTVEHVHVHTGGQAIVGSVSQSGRGIMTKTEDNPST